MARRYQQPQGNARIDWGNPNTKNLVAAILPHAPIDVLGGEFVAATGKTYQPVPQGLAGGFSLGSRVLEYIDANFHKKLTASKGAFLCLWIPTNVVNTAQYVASMREAAGSGSRYYLKNNAGAVEFGWATSATIAASPAKTWTLNKPSMIGMSWSAANNVRFLFEGEDVGGSTLSATGNILYSMIAGLAGGTLTTYSGQGYALLLLAFSEPISAAVFKSISDNPEQVFAPASRQIFVPATGGVTLSPPLLTNSNTFYSATVSAGAVSLAPSLFTNSSTFYSATVSLGGSTQTLTPALFTNSQSFFAPTVTPGAVSLAPALFTNSNTFYSPVVTNGVTLSSPLLTNSQTFYGATVTLGAATLYPALLANSNTFYSATLTGGATRKKGLRKTRYTPSRPPASLGESGRYIQQELERIVDGLESPFTHEMLELLSVEPGRKPTSAVMLAAADGTNWNPGSGRGLYLYYGGAWALVKAF